MAASFNGTSAYLTRTANVPPLTATTACCWFSLNSTSPAWAQVIALGNTSGTPHGGAGASSVGGTGPIWGVNNGSAQAATGVTPAVGQAVFMAITNDGTTLRVLMRTVNQNTLSAASVTGMTGTANAIRFANSVFDGTDFAPVTLWQCRAWDRVLTDAELLAESFADAPVSRRDINFAWRLRTPQDLLDISGNNRPPTVTGTPTHVKHQGERLVNPRAPRRRQLVASASGAVNATVNGQTLTATASVVAGSASADSSVAGQTATANASVVAGSVGAGSSVAGQTITATVSVIPGAASATGDAAVNGQTLTATASVVAGSVSAGASVAGQTATATASVVAGSAAAGASVAGQTLTASASVLAGSASADSTVNGQTLTASASVLAGAASGAGDATVNGQVVTAAASVVQGSVAFGNTVSGQLLVATASVLQGSAFGPSTGAPSSRGLDVGVGLGL